MRWRSAHVAQADEQRSKSTRHHAAGRRTRFCSSSAQNRHGLHATTSAGFAPLHSCSLRGLPSAPAHSTVRVRVPPHAWLQAVSATTRQRAGSHGLVLHARAASGFGALPSHADSGKDWLRLRHATLRVCVPPPQAALQAPHWAVVHAGAAQASGSWQGRRRLPAYAARKR